MTQSADTRINGVNLYKEFLLHTRKVFSRQRSSFNLILGRRGTGKTNFDLLLHEVNHQLFPNMLHAANIRISSATFKIEYISDLETLREWSEAFKDLPKMFSLDEAGRVIKRRRFMAAINVKFIDDLQILRKYNLHTLYITQSERNLDSNMLDTEFLDGFYDKTGLETVEYTDIFQRHTISAIFDDIPETQIQYNTLDTAEFSEFKQKNENVQRYKDPDIKLAVERAKGLSYEKYKLDGGTLGRSGFYDRCNAGVIKLDEIASKFTSLSPIDRGSPEQDAD